MKPKTRPVLEPNKYYSLSQLVAMGVGAKNTLLRAEQAGRLPPRRTVIGTRKLWLGRDLIEPLGLKPEEVH